MIPTGAPPGLLEGDLPKGLWGSRGGSIKSKFFLLLLLIAAGSAGYYHFVYRPARRAPVEMAYVLPDSIAVADAPAQVRVAVATLKSGDRVQVLERWRNWARVRLASGRVGWVDQKNLVDVRAYEAGRSLRKELENFPAQAVGRTTRAATLRLEPSRDAPQLAQLPEEQSVEIFRRHLVERPPEPNKPPYGPSGRDAWYLVRTGAEAGWVMGRLVALEVPEGISLYAHGLNLVAWLVLNTVDDDGRRVPQYLVADRVGTQEFDFNHIRVLTWWIEKGQYATAYVESNVNGFFPIRVMRVNDVPHFRLRLVGKDGHKFQKVYGLFGTIVRPLGTVKGWDSDAMPARPLSRSVRAP